MTTAEIFADYLGMTPANAAWAYRSVVYASGRREHTLTATSPLAPEPTPGWLEVLVRHKSFGGLVPLDSQSGFKAYISDWRTRIHTKYTHPTHAVARALLAADLTLRARCQEASDWREVCNA